MAALNAAAAEDAGGELIRRELQTLERVFLGGGADPADDGQAGEPGPRPDTQDPRGEFLVGSLGMTV